MRAVSDTVQVARQGEEDYRRTCRVKLILATNEAIEQLLAKDRLRKDLLFRVRHRISIAPLKERLVAKGGHDLLSRLWCLNRWRSNHHIKLDASGRLLGDDISHEEQLQRTLAPKLPDEAMTILRTHAWPGNLREFERVCFDALWEYDRPGANSLQDWADVFQRALTLGASLPEGVTPLPVDNAVLERARQAEKALMRHDFKVVPAQAELAHIKLKSHAALKRFLRKNQVYLTSPEWKSNPRALRLLSE